jgi:hypothetical protein
MFTRMEAHRYCLRKALIIETEKQISKADQPTTGCIAKPERGRIGEYKLATRLEPAMRRTIATACVLTMLSGAVWAQQPSPHTPQLQKTVVAKKKKASQKKNVPAEAPQVPAQTMPPVPATLMNSAPVQPSVTMEGGMLTIDAPNSTLSDVLSGVRKATGAAIEGASPSERVAVRLGPGKPEQVISALLRGTPYDYVILGASGRPDVVTRVLLTQSAGESMPGSTGATRSAEVVQPQPADDIQRERTPDETQPNEGEAEQAQPQVQPQAQPQAQPQPSLQAQPDQNQPKTPEQLFKELQQMQQQNQQAPK